MKRTDTRNSFTCLACGKTFEVPRCRGQVKYCNAACRRTKTRGADNPNWKGGLVDCKCKECGASFRVKQKVIRNGYGKYCSHRCKAKVRSRSQSAKASESRVKKQCIVCGKEVRIKQSHAATEGKHCSIKCRSITYTSSMLGAKNPNYKGPDRAGLTHNRKLRILAKNIKDHTSLEWEDLKTKYGNACACCKRTDSKLTKDHIVPVTKGGHNGIDNIQPLCHSCNCRKSAKTIKY